MQYCKNRRLFTILFILSAFVGFSQTTYISVNSPTDPETSYTPEQLIKDVLIGAGDCAEVDFVYLQENPAGAFNPSQKSWGYFDATGTSFPFDKGIILTTGFASNAVGPNNNSGITGNGTGWLGDNDLKTILDIQSGDNMTTNNATVFQFTFVPSIPNISFDFIFASEEYENEFECQGMYRDGFAFLLKGPGIPDTSGTTYGGINIAAISGSTGVPVSTISIHSNDFMCGSEIIGTNFFPDLYVSNSGDNNLNEIQYDGHTVPLTAQATLIPGETYELKIVIADRGDAAYDSAVFFQAGSFNIGLNLGDDLTVEDSTAPCNLDTITIGVESKPFEIYQWFAYDGSGFNEIPGETSSYLDVSVAGVYGLELTYGIEECTYFDSVTVEFADNPVAYQPSTLIGCESMSEDGFAQFILTDRDAQIINGQTDMIVMYFDTLQKAEEGNPANQLISPYINTEIWGQTIFARIEQIDYDCSDITELNLIVCQPCLENYILNSQAEVDFFGQTYSHCTDVIGDVIVEGEDITDLTGLNSLVSVGGDFTIQNNPSLNDLNGLSNLVSVNGNFSIIDNPALSEIADFSSLSQIDGHFWLKDLPSLTLLSAFTSLNHIGNEFWIQNTELQNLDSLENIMSIGGKLALEDNPSMNNISGLSNINPETILGELGLYIINNASLSVCSLPNFCTYLNGEGNRTINENAGYCFDQEVVLLDCIPCEIPTNLKAVNILINTADLNWAGEEELFDIEWGEQGFTLGSGVLESNIGGTEYNLSELMANTKYDFYVRTYCETKQSDWAGPHSFMTLKDCPTGNFTFTSQQQIDDFGTEYAHCSDIILNNVTIQGANITNLNGLNKISEITGFLDIKNNSQLQNLTGLNALTHIGTALQISYNPSLLSLNGLSSLTQMEEGYIHIENNGQLNDISDLQNINPAFISEEYGLYIVNNAELSVCDLLNFCTYLQGTGVRTISGNAGTCFDETTLVNVCNGECLSFTVWNGTSWSNGAPDETKKTIIEGNLTITDDLTVCELLLNSGTLTISSGASLTVNRAIKNTQNETNFIVENGANLIQTDDVENTGEITVYRNSSNIKHLNYTLWSSPVTGQALKAFSPQTLWYRIYDYNGQTDVWEQVFPNSTTPDVDFEQGIGYMFRAPNDFVTTPYVYNGEFTGVPNNGDITVMFNPLGTYQGVGNPYPSNISITDFWAGNSGTGTLYFWTNTNPWDSSLNGGNGDYVGNNWATYNLTGGVSSESADNDATDKKPNGFIPVGQGFMVEAPMLPSVTFTNAMRTSNEGVFFKTMEEEKHRLWLNLSDETFVLNQTLIGYIAQATNGEDFGIDAKLFGYLGSALYSLIENTEDDFVIQGRALPFDDNDVVPLGFRANEAGSYTVSLADFDGIFAEGQDIYLRDNFTQTEQNLKEGNYTFVSEQGIFSTRFEVVYKQSGTLDIINPDLNNSWIIYKQNNVFHIFSEGFEMKEVMVYDVLGRVVYSSSSEGNSHILPNLGANQVLIVKVITTEGEVLSKKVSN